MNQSRLGAIPRSDLEYAVYVVNKGLKPLTTMLCGIGVDDQSDDWFIFSASNKAAYWFLFDNLNREDAQLLWVLRTNWVRFGINRISPQA
jgi:hypothetical protein